LQNSMQGHPAPACRAAHACASCICYPWRKPQLLYTNRHTNSTPPGTNMFVQQRSSRKLQHAACQDTPPLLVRLFAPLYSCTATHA
jgi:hypothetical protein